MNMGVGTNQPKVSTVWTEVGNKIMCMLQKQFCKSYINFSSPNGQIKLCSAHNSYKEILNTSKSNRKLKLEPQGMAPIQVISSKTTPIHIKENDVQVKYFEE